MIKFKRMERKEESMIRMRWGLFVVIVITAVVGLTISAPNKSVVEVPQIEGLSEALASKNLSDKGLGANFKRCFSNTVEKHFVISGSQDPKGGISWFVGDKVNASVSQGPFPSFIGFSKNRAIEAIDDLNLVPEIVEGRNKSYGEDFVYSQEPWPAEAFCLTQGFVVKLFVNSSSRIVITEPEENQVVNSSIILVKGRLLDPLNKNEHIWLTVSPIRSISEIWPQSTSNRGEIIPVNSEFVGNVLLEGVRDDLFEIGVIIVDNEINEKIVEWNNISRSQNIWPSITEGYPRKNLFVPWDVIKKQEKAKVVVKLGE